MNTTAFRSANGDGSGAAPRSAPFAEHFPLTRRDYAFIVGFWLLYALLTIANHAFDSGPPDRRPDWTLTTWIIIELAQAGLWMLLTPLIVSMVGRARSERVSRGVNVLVLILLGVIVALAVSVFGYELRDVVRSASPPRAAGGAGGGGHGPPLWFGFLNALVIYLGVLAAGLARAYSLRLRARGASRRRSCRRSSPRRGSTRCAASSIRTSSSTRSTRSRRSSSATRAACGA